jgi:hypothetical protein
MAVTGLRIAIVIPYVRQGEQDAPSALSSLTRSILSVKNERIDVSYIIACPPDFGDFYRESDFQEATQEFGDTHFVDTGRAPLGKRLTAAVAYAWKMPPPLITAATYQDMDDSDGVILLHRAEFLPGEADAMATYGHYLASTGNPRALFGAWKPRRGLPISAGLQAAYLPVQNIEFSPDNDFSSLSADFIARYEVRSRRRARENIRLF